MLRLCMAIVGASPAEPDSRISIASGLSTVAHHRRTRIPGSILPAVGNVTNCRCCSVAGVSEGIRPVLPWHSPAPQSNCSECSWAQVQPLCQLSNTIDGHHLVDVLMTAGEG
ncbi:hypothetical protein QC762_0106560 [Podospora pseudocomata]|uniref:Uncharacterized protein n=1 Tax=Podospora pseudocomata TaxID=2093779 RepID=A0ABR0G324_9PEZI|nr:hypothetical protein QC762_0106560 [Podospora pseudocomata]